MMRKIRVKGQCFLAVVIFTAFLTGCGGEGERTQGAMQLIRDLDYRGALEQLDLAEENGENIRLVNRARGIAVWGLPIMGRLRLFLRKPLPGAAVWCRILILI